MKPDFQSPTWKFIEAHAKERIDQCRTALEAPGMDVVTTEMLRAEIKALRGILKMAEPLPEFRMQQPKVAAGY
jgi:hypothetical protein